MQFTQSDSINVLIKQLDERIRTLIPGVQSMDRPGYRSTSYFLSKGMKNEVCYILCYDQKANLGFTSGVRLIRHFPFLKGTGKTHRHVPINDDLLKESTPLNALILKAFEGDDNTQSVL
jgi:hypothetical protein